MALEEAREESFWSGAVTERRTDLGEVATNKKASGSDLERPDPIHAVRGWVPRKESAGERVERAQLVPSGCVAVVVTFDVAVRREGRVGVVVGVEDAVVVLIVELAVAVGIDVLVHREDEVAVTTGVNRILGCSNCLHVARVHPTPDHIACCIHAAQRVSAASFGASTSEEDHGAVVQRVHLVDAEHCWWVPVGDGGVDGVGDHNTCRDRHAGCLVNDEGIREVQVAVALERAVAIGILVVIVGDGDAIVVLVGADEVEVANRVHVGADNLNVEDVVTGEGVPRGVEQSGVRVEFDEVRSGLAVHVEEHATGPQ